MGILSTALTIFLKVLYVLLLIRILTSWFRPSTRTAGNGWFFMIDGLVWRATEPLLAPIRNLLPSSGMGLDFAPLILFFLIQFVGNFLVRLLMNAGL
jgi:YggT family protein